MGRLFGTDGVRGIANRELTAELAFSLGQAGAAVLSRHTNQKTKIVIGKDTRISGDMLEAALVAGICSVGAEAVIAGVVPTPAIAHAVRLLGASAGIVISASHNSMEYNGIKFFNAEGYKLNDEIEDEIESIILDGKDGITLPINEGLGVTSQRFDLKDDYIDFAKSTAWTDLSGMKIALDCANGASFAVAAPVFEQLGAEVCVINNTPDGTNINANCGSTHIEGLQKLVAETGADIGLAFDGDADRVLAADENGVLVDGDKIMSICGMHMKQNGKLTNNTIVATVMSNLGLFIMGDTNGINIAKTKVGDRYVIEEMKEKGHSLGGEQSGHIIFLEHNTTGDGIVTGVQLACVLKDSGAKLSALAEIMQVMPQVLLNAKVKNENKNSYLENDMIKMEIEKIEQYFSGKGRVLIRPSGTEPLVRVMIEGSDIGFITEKAKYLATLIETELG